MSQIGPSLGAIDGLSQPLDEPLNEDEEALKQRETTIEALIKTLPRSRIARLWRHLTPLLKFDIVGFLPTEIALTVFLNLSPETLIVCAQVNHRWRILADDPSLWRAHCASRGWEWRQNQRIPHFETRLPSDALEEPYDDDEGMGDSDSEDDLVHPSHHLSTGGISLPPLYDMDSGLTSMSVESDEGVTQDSTNVVSVGQSVSTSILSTTQAPTTHTGSLPLNSKPSWARHSAPSALPTQTDSARPDYKLLYRTHCLLQHRFRSRSYRLSALQTRGAPANAHTHAIYCLQLYTYPSGTQTLFTGSRDRTIREWNLRTGLVERVIPDLHSQSILSLCVGQGYVASGSSDRGVAIFDLEKNRLVKKVVDHEDSVLCVRFDGKRLVSCSKDRTVRTYSFPDMRSQFVFTSHRAAVNAVAISGDLIVSASGDRSIRLWDAYTGFCLQTFENHSSRGIASIDFAPPYVLSGSSDKHLRFFDITTLQGWTTHPNSPYHGPPGLPTTFTDLQPVVPASTETLVCHHCGSPNLTLQPIPTSSQDTNNAQQQRRSVGGRVRRCTHGDLVRSVVLGEDFVVSGSYDLSIRVWDRKTGALVADLTGGHTSRIFCIAVDCTKIISCGEDQRICLWDFSYGIDTSFIKL